MNSKRRAQLQRCLLQWKMPFTWAADKLRHNPSLSPSLAKLPWRPDTSAVSWAALPGWERKMPFSVAVPGPSGEGWGGQAVLPLSYWGFEIPGDRSRKASLRWCFSFCAFTGWNAEQKILTPSPSQLQLWLKIKPVVSTHIPYKNSTT